MILESTILLLPLIPTPIRARYEYAYATMDPDARTHYIRRMHVHPMPVPGEGVIIAPDALTTLRKGKRVVKTFGLFGEMT